MKPGGMAGARQPAPGFTDQFPLQPSLGYGAGGHWKQGGAASVVDAATLHGGRQRATIIYHLLVARVDLPAVER